MAYYVYILKSEKDHKWYTGCTSDLKRRLIEHNQGKNFSTKKRFPFKLIYYELCLNSKDAYAREKYLKTGMGKRYIKNRLKNYFNS
jgi:putative endonuclease